MEAWQQAFPASGRERPAGAGGAAMTESPRRAVESMLARLWAQRLRSLQSSLHLDPGDPYAGYWHIQARVVSFLLARYGDDPNLPWPGESPRPAHGEYGEFHPPTGKPPRSAKPIRHTLERIAETNRACRP